LDRRSTANIRVVGGDLNAHRLIEWLLSLTIGEAVEALHGPKFYAPAQPDDFVFLSAWPSLGATTT